MTSTHQNTHIQPGPPRSWRRRLLALALGLSMFVVAEGVCVLFDWGRPDQFNDPFVDFSTIHPLFVASQDGDRFEIATSRLKFFASESFPARKGENTFRVFCLGGSTVQGRPYSKPTSFTSWLELSLQAAEPERDWEVINCGGVSYASYRLVPILTECLGYDADLIILCTGHNEFLEERTYADVRDTPSFLKVPREWLSRFRTFHLFQEAFRSVAPGSSGSAVTERPVLGAEVDALLDYQNGLSAYQRDTQRSAAIMEHFEFNLRRMVAMAGSADVPVLLMCPPSNLRDCPPFKSQHRDGLSQDDLSKWETLIKGAQAHYRTDLPQAIELLIEAVELDDQYAFTYFELGKCRISLGQYAEARTAFQASRELDVCPLRILEPMEQSLQRVAGDFNVPLINAHQLLERECPGGILGNGLLVDHIHPSPARGHQLIATALRDEMIRQGWVHPVDGWSERTQESFQRHYASLENIYFLRGQRTLKELQAWSQGRAAGPPISSRGQKVSSAVSP